MKIAFILLLVGASALALPEPPARGGQRKYKVADKEFLARQKNILRLYNNINQPSYYADHVEISKNFNIENRLDDYSNREAVTQCLASYKRGWLSRGEVFSPFYEPQLRQAISLFRVFYYAKTYEAFYKTAVWARNNINEGIFLYALSVAIVQREDTYGIVLPPIYEIYPNYFFNNEVIQEVQRYKQQYRSGQQLQQDGTGYNGYTINANYSGWYLNLNREQSLAYYTEDVGINAFYYYYNLYYPYWLDGEEFRIKNDRRGEQFYFLNQQLLARYYLERLSNDLGEIPNIDYENPVQSGYYSSLRYPNGLQFPSRPNNARLNRRNENDRSSSQSYRNYTDGLTQIRDYERRIRDAIDLGYFLNDQGENISIKETRNFEILANLIESNQDSPNRRFYGPLQILARQLLGNSYYPLDQYRISPSVLEQFETSLRDPAYYQIYKRIIGLFQRYKNYQPPYSYNELNFPGVKVEGIQIDRLITYFDDFYSDLSNAVYLNEEEYGRNEFQARARQYRLNHKPFNYVINLSSDVAEQAVIRVYLGPKSDEYGRRINVNDNRLNFVELDYFEYKLQTGRNSIERNSRQNYYASDRTTIRELSAAVEAAIQGQREFQLDGSEAYYGYPNRYLLPKGKVGGQAYQLYVIVSQQESEERRPQTADYYYPRVGSGGRYLDSNPFGYPFDKPIDEYNFWVPNSYLQDVVIYHRKLEEVNVNN